MGVEVAVSKRRMVSPAAGQLAVALLSGNSTALDVLNQWLNLLQSVQLPFALKHMPVKFL